MPGIGSIYHINNPRLVALRKWVVKGFNNHLIFYLVDDDYIEIVRLIHGSRDISQILEEEQ